MKSVRIFLVFSLFVGGASLFAQRTHKVQNDPLYDERPYHFGFQLGINQFFFKINSIPGFQKQIHYNTSTFREMPDLNLNEAYLYSIESTSYSGFVIEVVTNLRMGKYFDLRFTPGLSFGERALNYTILGFSDTDTSLIRVDKHIQSTFVEFPLTLKFKGNRIHNARPYLLGGVKYSIDLSSDAKKKDNATAAQVFVNSHDVYAELGAGFDFYTTYFKFGVELRMSYGLRDVLKHDDYIYTTSINSLHSKMFQLVFTFE